MHNEGTKVHKPWRYILSCIVIHVCMLYVAYMLQSIYMATYVYSTHKSTGKYMEACQKSKTQQKGVKVRCKSAGYGLGKLLNAITSTLHHPWCTKRATNHSLIQCLAFKCLYRCMMVLKTS